jgi:hypothetical protein
MVLKSAGRFGLCATLKSLVFLAVLSTMLPGQARASESHCHSIKDADQRNHCLAMAKRQDSYCHSIREQDLRNLCLAQTRGQRSYCHSIRSSDSRNQCLALVR